MEEKVAAGCKGSNAVQFYVELRAFGVTDDEERRQVAEAAQSVCPEVLNNDPLASSGFAPQSTQSDVPRSEALLEDIRANYSATSWGSSVVDVSPMGDIAVVRISDASIAADVCRGVGSLVFSAGSPWSGLWVQANDGVVVIKRESATESC